MYQITKSDMIDGLKDYENEAYAAVRKMRSCSREFNCGAWFRHVERESKLKYATGRVNGTISMKYTAKVHEMVCALVRRANTERDIIVIYDENLRAFYAERNHQTKYVKSEGITRC